MSRRLPAGNRVVGHDERDDPGRVLCRGPLVGVLRRVDFCALHGPAYGVVAEPASASPFLIQLGEHRTHHPDQGFPGREHLHDAAPPLELSVGALLHVVGAQPHVVLVGEVQVGQGVGLGLLKDCGGLGAEALYLAYGQLVQFPHQLRVALREHGLEDAEDRGPLLPGRRVAGGVAHQVHDAALPRGAGEDLLDRAPEALVRIAGDADDAVDPARPQREKERPPAVVGLRVDGVEPQKAPVPARAGADGGHERGGLHAAGVPALDVGGVEPDVGVGDVGQVAFLQVGDRLVQRRAHPRHLAGAHSVYAHGLRHALHLPGGHAVGHHLGDRGDDRAVRARVALDQVLREVAPRAQLRDPEVDGPHAGGEPALAVSVSLVAGLAGLVGLGVHDLVDERLGHDPDQLRHVHHAVVESRHQGRIGRHFVYRVHMRLLPFHES